MYIFKIHKAKIYSLKEEVDKFAMIVTDFNTSLLVTDRTAEEKKLVSIKTI